MTSEAKFYITTLSTVWFDCIKDFWSILFEFSFLLFVVISKPSTLQSNVTQPNCIAQIDKQALQLT